MPALSGSVALGLVALVAGCASGGSSADPVGDGPPLEEVVAESHGRSTVGMEDVRIWRDDATVKMAVPASVERVMQALPAVYRALEIPLTVHDVDRGIVGNPGWEPRRIAGERPTDYIRCGSGNSLTSHSGSYAYRVSVETRVRPGEERRAVLETQLSATARPRSVTGSRIRCVSRYRLERTIHGAVLGALEKAESQG